MEDLAIKHVRLDGLSFVAEGKDGDGGQFEETFMMAPGEVYKKVAWGTMGQVVVLSRKYGRTNGPCLPPQMPADRIYAAVFSAGQSQRAAASSPTKDLGRASANAVAKRCSTPTCCDRAD